MAYLHQPETGDGFPLLAHHTVGTLKGRVDTYIDNPYVSRRHLAIEWTGDHWQLKDFSRNGTWLNGERLAKGQYYPLTRNDRIQLAGPNGLTLTLKDAAAPRDLLVPLSGDASLIIELDTDNLIPDSKQPEWRLFFDDQLNEWQAESRKKDGRETRPLRHNDLIDCRTGSWQLFRAKACAPTRERGGPHSITQCELVFDVSQDEETTHLTVRGDGFKRSLGIRAHHYLLLELARRRKTGLETSQLKCNQGWVDNELISRELGMELPHLNIQIHRARRQLMEVLPAINHRSLVERRGSNIRLGCSRFTILKAGTVEYRSTSTTAVQTPSITE